MENAKKWWQDEVLLFKCEQCGKCCSQRGIVMFTDEDVVRAADYLEMKPEIFRKTYLQNVRGREVMFVRGYVSPCHFLNKNKTCRIQDAKPMQCRTYPFWPQILESKQAWDNNARRCKGVGHGKTIDIDSVVINTDLFGEMPPDVARDFMLILNCGRHFVAGGDGLCRSDRCILGKDKEASVKIQSQGCGIYRLYENMEKQSKEVGGEEKKD